MARKFQVTAIKMSSCIKKIRSDTLVYDNEAL